MTSRKAKKTGDPGHEVFSETPEVALNPLTGLHLKDLAAATGKTVFHGIRQPVTLTKHAASLTGNLLDVFFSNKRYQPKRGDFRFTDPAWQDNWFYRNLLQSYLALNESMNDWVNDLDVDEIDRVRAEFLVRLVSESGAPTNTLLGNPTAIRKSLDSRGQSLLQGVKNLIADVKDNHCIPSQVKKDSFTVGKDVAATPGTIVFKNEMLELIQYKAGGKQVYRRPALMVPPQINKYYGMDLSADKSLIKWCVDSGLQLFCISWRNPRPEHALWGIDEYACATKEAVKAVKSITRCKDINLVSFCSGGTTASAMAAHLDAIGDQSIHSMTIGVCILEAKATDMELGAFANEATLRAVKKRSMKKGMLRGHELALSMLWLRPNDLIWGNVVNNYLLGNEPPEFDIFFWNNDWTNLTAKLHADFIDIFWEKLISIPNELIIGETPIDIRKLGCDKFIIAGISDHITPWKACYRSARLFEGDNVEFYLSRSGHVQSMMNSPAKKNASYYHNPGLVDSAEEWLDGAKQVDESWWLRWRDWMQSRSGELKTAPGKPGNSKYKPGAPAPGDYVLESSDF